MSFSSLSRRKPPSSELSQRALRAKRTFWLQALPFAAVLIATFQPAHAQEPSSSTESAGESAPPESGPWAGFDEFRVTPSAGLIQPLLLRGGNVELDVFYRRFVMGYSHGFLLKLEGDTVVGEAHEQGLSFHLPYSTGLSIGYRLLEWLDVRLEAKAHRFEVRRAGDQELVNYTTYTLGVGVYAQYRPFYHFGVRIAEWLEGFVATTSVRYWPNLATTLDDDEHIYSVGSENVRHRAANIGIANTPFFFNISLGYMFAF